MAAKFTKGDEIAMRGTVTLVHEEEYGRRRVTVRLEGFDYPHGLGRICRPHRQRRAGQAGPCKHPLYDDEGERGIEAPAKEIAMWLELTDTDGKPVVVNMDHVISFRAEGDRTSLNLNLAGRQTIEVKETVQDLKARVAAT